MSKALKNITVWIAGAAMALVLAACGSPSPGPTPDPDPAAPPATASAAEPGAEVTGEQEFEGEVSTETITANNMDIEIPTGLRIPEDTLVTKAEPSMIMMADEDPTAVSDMVKASAKEAGYEVYAETPNGQVLVGHGNAVQFTADPQVQIITWGPEVMKDVLSGN